MPKRSTLKFRDAMEARAWMTDPKGEPQDLRQKITQAVVTYASTRPQKGLRARLQDGADRFLNAARLAEKLLLQAESKRNYGDGISTQAGLPRKLVRALRSCGQYSAQEIFFLDSLLYNRKRLDANGRLTDQDLRPQDVELLQPDPDWSIPPDWWCNDRARMASTAINLRVLAFSLQREVYSKRREEGRPRDGNRLEFIKESWALGLTIRTMAQLLAGLMVDPPGLEDPRVAFNTRVTDEWYRVREAAWFRALNETLRQERDRRNRGGKPAGKI